MKYIPAILGGLLGLLFIGVSLPFLLGMVPEQPAPPEGTAIAAFQAAFGPTGYLHFVKIVELIGGVLVAWPRTRTIGLLLLIPVVVNVVAFHALLTGGAGVFSPMLVGIGVIIVALVWLERRAFLALIAPVKQRLKADDVNA